MLFAQLGHGFSITFILLESTHSNNTGCADALCLISTYTHSQTHAYAIISILFCCPGKGWLGLSLFITAGVPLSICSSSLFRVFHYIFALCLDSVLKHIDCMTSTYVDYSLSLSSRSWSISLLRRTHAQTHTVSTLRNCAIFRTLWPFRFAVFLTRCVMSSLRTTHWLSILQRQLLIDWLRLSSHCCTIRPCFSDTANTSIQYREFRCAKESRRAG